MPSSVKTIRNAYRSDIDGLRALAVLSVFLFHLKPDLYPGGFLGVDVFFVISGYLITGIIVGELARETFSFRNFFARRIKRIFPALFVLILITAAIAIFLLTPESYVNFLDSARYSSGQLSNIFFSRKVGYFSEGFNEQPLLHTWSLGVEEQFYLVWPLLIWLFVKCVRRAGQSVGFPAKNIVYSPAALMFFVILGFVSFLLCFFLADFEFQLAFYMFYARAWEFCFGAVLTLQLIPSPGTKRGKKLVGYIGFVLLGISFLLVEHSFLGLSFLKFGVILPCLGASLLILAGQGQLYGVNRALSARLPAFIGRISYSLYLYHWPVIIFYKSLTGQHELTFVSSVIIFFIALTCSVLSYYFIEQPCRKTDLHDKYIYISALAIIALFVFTSKYLKQFDDAEWRIKPYKATSRPIPPFKPPACKIHHKNGVIYYDCPVAGNADAPMIALVGDSHSPHFSHAVVSWAQENDVHALFLSVPGCSMLLGDVKIRSMIDPKHEQGCRTALPFFNKLVYDRPEVQLIAIAQRFDLFYDGKGYSNTQPQILFSDKKGRPIMDHQHYYEQQLDYTVKEIRKQGKDVVLLKQVPILSNKKACDWEPKLKQLLGIGRVCFFDEEFLAKWQQPSIDFVDRFARSNRVRTIDPFQFIDSPLQKGVNIYSNTDHLNSFGFEYAIPFIREDLNELIEVDKTIRVKY